MIHAPPPGGQATSIAGNHIPFCPFPYVIRLRLRGKGQLFYGADTPLTSLNRPPVKHQYSGVKEA
jgi:hypothetical protein